MTSSFLNKIKDTLDPVEGVKNFARGAILDNIVYPVYGIGKAITGKSSKTIDNAIDYFESDSPGFSFARLGGGLTGAIAGIGRKAVMSLYPKASTLAIKNPLAKGVVGTGVAAVDGGLHNIGMDRGAKNTKEYIENAKSSAIVSGVLSGAIHGSTPAGKAIFNYVSKATSSPDKYAKEAIALMEKRKPAIKNLYDSLKKPAKSLAKEENEAINKIYSKHEVTPQKNTFLDHLTDEPLGTIDGDDLISNVMLGQYKAKKNVAKELYERTGLKSHLFTPKGNKSTVITPKELIDLKDEIAMSHPEVNSYVKKFILDGDKTLANLNMLDAHYLKSKMASMIRDEAKKAFPNQGSIHKLRKHLEKFGMFFDERMKAIGGEVKGKYDIAQQYFKENVVPFREVDAIRKGLKDFEAGKKRVKSKAFLDNAYEGMHNNTIMDGLSEDAQSYLETFGHYKAANAPTLTNIFNEGVDGERFFIKIKNSKKDTLLGKKGLLKSEAMKGIAGAVDDEYHFDISKQERQTLEKLGVGDLNYVEKAIETLHPTGASPVKTHSAGFFNQFKVFAKEHELEEGNEVNPRAGKTADELWEMDELEYRMFGGPLPKTLEEYEEEAASYETK